MKTKEEFKAKLKDGEFIKLFTGSKTAQDVSKVAQSLGYDIKPTDVKSTNLTDDMLEAVAGGKGSNEQSNQFSAQGGGQIQVDSSKNKLTDADSTSDPNIDVTVKPDINLDGLMKK